MEAIETFKHAGMHVEIIPDADGELANPRDSDNFGILVFDHSVQTGLGEESLDSMDIEVRNLWKECERCEGTNVINSQLGKYAPGDPGDAEECPDCNGGQVPMTIEAYFAEFFDAIVSKPIRYEDYGSSGSQVRVVTDDDDANGVIFATEASAETTGVPKEKYVEALEGEIAILNTWLEGGVYGYTVREFEGGKVLDSCWGFLAEYADTSDEGGWKYLLDEAKRAATEQAERLKDATRIDCRYEVVIKVPVEGPDEVISPSADVLAKAIYNGIDIDTPSAIEVRER